MRLFTFLLFLAFAAQPAAAVAATAAAAGSPSPILQALEGQLAAIEA